MNTRPGLLTLCVTCLPAVAFAADRGEVLGIYHSKQFIPLRLDPAHVVVKAPASAVAPAIAALGINPALAAQHDLPGEFWMITTPAGTVAESQIRALVSALAAQAGITYVSPVFFDDLGGPMFPTPAIITGFVPATDREALAHAEKLTAWGAPEWESFPDMDLAKLDLRDGFSVIALANRLSRCPGVLFAEPDMTFTGAAALIPNDQGFFALWGLHNTGQQGGDPAADMNGPEAWDITTGSSTIRCQIIDSGIDLGHADLNLGGPHADFTGQGGDGRAFNACDNHGTAVAGCISARMNNGIGVVGIAPSCRSQSARCFIASLTCNGSWTSNSSWTIAALNQAQSSGCRVTNNSNIYGFTSAGIESAYAATKAAGLVHFAAAGNSGTGSIAYPAGIPVVNSVAAMDRFNRRTTFSQFGPGLDFAAPGLDVWTTDRTGSAGYTADDYVLAYGTSFASPYAAGVACLILSLNSTLSASEVEHIMQATCKPLGAPGYDTDFGWGFVDAAAAVRAALPACDPDLNNDGNADQADIDYLIDVIAGGANNTGIDPDFNHDGNTDQADVDALINVIAGGPCV